MEQVFAGGNLDLVQYWISDSNSKTGRGHWSDARTTPRDQKRTRVSGLVHESCVVSAGPKNDPHGYSCDPVTFQPYGTSNVYVTGSGLWPVASSWNPTMTMCGFAQKLADNLHNEANRLAARTKQLSPSRKRSASSCSSVSAVVRANPGQIASGKIGVLDSMEWLPDMDLLSESPISSSSSSKRRSVSSSSGRLDGKALSAVLEVTSFSAKSSSSSSSTAIHNGRALNTIFALLLD